MTESADQAHIRLALGREPGLRLFRNNVGEGWVGKTISSQPGGFTVLKNARRIAFGLFEGSSDLIGWQSVIVTPDMVGQRVAIFASPEIKAVGGRHPVTPEQENWIRVVNEMGGRAGVARTPEDARAIFRLPPL